MESNKYLKILLIESKSLMTTWVNKHQRMENPVNCAHVERSQNRFFEKKKAKRKIKTNANKSREHSALNQKKVLFAYLYTLPLWIPRASSGLIDFTILFPSPFLCCSAQFINKLCWDTEKSEGGGRMENNWKHWRHFEAKSIKEM